MNANAHKLLTLGRFAIGYICDNPHVLFKQKINEINWEESAKDVIAKFYELAGLPDRPAWLDEPLKDDSAGEGEGVDELDEFERAKAQVRTVLLNHFNDLYNRHVRTLTQPIRSNLDEKIIDYPNTDLPLMERVKFCIDKTLIYPTLA